jgi:tetratricopeptide (TPR) repeat protein
LGGAGLVLLGLMLPAFAVAQSATGTGASDEEARALFEAGRLAHAQGRYAEAVERFQRAYDLSKRAPLLYNIAVALDRLRRDEEALHNFEEFVRLDPNSEYIPAARERIVFLRQAIEERKGSATAPPPTVVAPTPEETARAAAPSGPSPTDPIDQGEDDGDVLGQWWFWTAAGVVTVGVIVSIVALSGGGDDRVAAPLPLDGNTRELKL